MEEQLARGLLGHLDSLEILAAGGFDQVTEIWEAAALILIDDYQDILDEDGIPTGKTRKLKKQAFPDKRPDQMVLVRKTVTPVAANMAANIYLINRLAGAPACADPEDAAPEEDEQTTDLSKLSTEELEKLELLLNKASLSE